jgi:poly(beta-D-mannuronate) lyase
MYPEGDAGILTGAGTTVFDETESINENPSLEYDEDMSVWRTTSNTPLYDFTLSTLSIPEDIDGQARPIASNPGADHYSLESIRFPPLTAEDVGPDSEEGSTSSIFTNEKVEESFIYPVPSNDVIVIESIDSEIISVELFNVNGERVLIQQPSHPIYKITVNASFLIDGAYFVKVSHKNGLFEMKKVLIQH